MDTPIETSSIEALLAHSDWVRAVARRLVTDPAAADDVAQNSWVEALRKPPRREGNLRGWWSKVVTHQARMLGRGDSRRTAREQRAAQPEAQASLDELSQRAALQREVVGHVLALDEIFRAVVLLRFFEDQSPPQIAARLGLPLKTVHSRLQRAFDKLRERLDGEYGGRNNWCVVLAPLANTNTWLTTATQGAMIMSANAKMGWVVGVLLLGGLGIWHFGFDANNEAAPPAEDLALRVDAPETRELDSERELETQSAAGERESLVAAETSAAPVVEAAKDATTTVRGRVVNAKGEAVVNVSVIISGAKQMDSVRSGHVGSFELRYESSKFMQLQSRTGSACLLVKDPAWVTLRQSCVDPTNLEFEHLIVAVPARRVEGWIQDSDGAPVADADIRLSASNHALYGFPYALDLTTSVGQHTEADANGRFEFPSFPDTPGLFLNVFAPEFIAKTVALDTAQWPLSIELESISESDTVMLEGIVFDQNGNTVEDALVRLADSQAKSGPGGMFRLALGHVAEMTPLCAVKAGLLPAVLPRFGRVIDAQAGRPSPVELRLGGAPLEIHGHVLDANGAPCAGWTVSAIDEIEVSQFRVPIDTAEGLARASKRSVRTDAQGAFTLTGLFPREYKVQAYEAKKLQRTEGSIRAGETRAVLRSQTALMESLQGIVVDGAGHPLPAVSVQLGLKTSISSVGYASISGATTTTNENGRFLLEGVPNAHVFLQCSGESVLPTSYEFPYGYELDTHKIVAQRRCHFRIEVSSEHANATSARLKDAEGLDLQISRIDASGMSGFSAATIIEGKSEVLSTSDAAQTLVLYEGERELTRLPIRLDPEGVTVLRP